jgi:hypothetical protein
MKTIIIGATLVLALTQLRPAMGEDANHIIPGCRAVTDEQSFKDLAEARECLGIIEGMRVGATLQSHILKGPPPLLHSRHCHAQPNGPRCSRLHRPAVTNPGDRGPR